MTTPPRRVDPVPGLLFAAAVALRLVYAWRAHFPTMDTAIVGLMALDILDGARPMFFTGQGYMGALEAYLTAVAFAILSPGRVVMTLVPSLFAGLWAVLMFRLLRLWFGRPAAAAGALMVVLPAETALWYTTVPYGGYPEMYVFGTAMVLHAATRHASGRLRPRADACLFAGLVFLGAWTNLQIAPFLAAAGGLWLAILWPRRSHPSQWLPFALVPLALAAAVAPQLILSAANPSSPPLFEAEDPGGQIAHSLRALLKHDAAALATWTVARNWLDTLHCLLAAGIGLTGAAALIHPSTRRNRSPLLALTGIYLLVFSLLYFPHPMSGFTPRYLIGPAVWLSALAVAFAIGSPSIPLRRVAAGLLAVWLPLQMVGYLRSGELLSEEMRGNRDRVEAVVRAARELDLEAVRILGSEMEGHQSSVYSLHARNRPVFSSSYDERRLDAARVWHRAEKAGYVFPAAYEPYVRGTLEALDIESTITPAGPMRLMPVSVPADVHITSFPGDDPFPAGEEVADALLDRRDDTLWPESPRDTDSFTLRFPGPVNVTGLRFTTDPSHSFPYQYTVTGTAADGEEITLQDCRIRLGVSHVSGHRLYLKGYNLRMDMRWEPRELTSLTFTYQTGDKNRQPVGFSEVFVLRRPRRNPAEPKASDLEAWLAAHPDAEVICDPLLTARLWREMPGLNGGDRLTAPWNPRDPTTRPADLSLESGQERLLLVDRTYGEEVRNTLKRVHIHPGGASEAIEVTDFGSLWGFHLQAHHPARDLVWNGFTLLWHNEVPFQ